MLRRFGLQLLRGRDPRHQRQMNKHRILAPQFLPHLANRLQKRQRLNVAHRPADLHNRHVRAVGRDLAHGVLDLVGHVRNHLHRLPQVVSAPLLQDDLLVDAPGGQVVVPRQRRVRKALVVAQVKIGLRAVVGHENLAVLKRRHGSRVDIQVRVKLHQVNAQPATFKQAPDGSSRKALP